MMFVVWKLVRRQENERNSTSRVNERREEKKSENNYLFIISFFIEKNKHDRLLGSFLNIQKQNKSIAVMELLRRRWRCKHKIHPQHRFKEDKIMPRIVFNPDLCWNIEMQSFPNRESTIKIKQFIIFSSIKHNQQCHWQFKHITF